MEQGDVTAEDLKVFLQEADEQIQLLDEEIICLEKKADDVDLLQAIFRAAHTLKGSSGMLGFHKMGELTHAMEDTLDRLRKKTLTVSTELVDALLEALDALKALRENLGSGDEGDLDISPLVTALRAVAEPGESSAPTVKAGPSIATAVGANATATARLEAVSAAGLNAYAVHVDIDRQTAWSAVRCFQVCQVLSGLGEVIFSIPSQEEMEQENVGFQLQLLLASSQTPEVIRDGIASMEEIEAVDVRPWAEEAEAGTASGEPPRGQPISEGSPPEDGSDRRVIDLGRDARGRSQRDQLEMAAQKIEALQSVRIDVERLDSLMNMVGELVIDRTRIAQISRALQTRYKDDELAHALAETASHIVKVIDELNEGMMETRMLPIGLLFNKFPRLVRDLARNTGKNVDFVVEGEDTEIDRSVIEKIKDPLVHLIRNAVDHGIEDPETRKAAGKPLPATVRLTAHHAEGHIVIILQDDGKGIDHSAVKQSAVKRGAIAEEAAARLSDAEALDLIFESGVSTAEKATEISGRGVGMDVVRKGVGALNGLVKVDTSLHVGTTFTLQLPLTLATFPGLLVSAAGTAYAIPLSYVQETVLPQAGSVQTIGGREVLYLKGKILPLLRLSSICRNGSNGTASADNRFVVVVRAGENLVALLVDELMEQQEIVVRSLGQYMGETRGVTGASILGDGQVVLILDIASLIKAAILSSSSAVEPERRAS